MLQGRDLLKKFYAVALLILIFFLAGCGSDKNTELLFKTPSKPEVKASEVDAKLKELSGILSGGYDDMKELKYYYCYVPYDEDTFDEDTRVMVHPYVVVDKYYRPTLMEHLQYFGSYVIKFDTLYIKSANQVSKFHYKNVSVVSYKSEGYTGIMSDEVYYALKSAIESGYVRVRMEGKAGREEKELSEKEIAGIKAVFDIYEYLNQIKVVP